MPQSHFLLSEAPVLVDKPIDVTHFIGNATGASYTIAQFVMRVVDWILGVVGMEHNQTLVTILYASVVFLLALGVGKVAQIVIFRLSREIARRWDNAAYTGLRNARFFHKLCRIIPGVVFLILIEFTLSNHNVLSNLFTKCTLFYIVITSAMALNAIVTAAWQQVNERENKRRLPLRGLSELVTGVIWIVAIIIVVCILVNKSPAALLAGLGAFAAVLMLIFKDSILGLVAGVQLSENDTLHVGDWIKVNGTDANGTVTEVTLTSVKVLNWDKTTTTLPPYSLVSGSFTNYRTMQESNTRRICRSYMIDADSVLAATDEMLAELRQLPFMDDYIGRKLAQRAAGQVADVNNPAGLVNGTIDTNLGLFRAYFKMWLDANGNISHDSDCFVSTLPQTSGGIPFQVYCFTNTSAWFAYEAIKDSVFEHLAAMLHFFRLYAFENPSGRDTVVDGYLSPGRNIGAVFGVPYPFFNGQTSPDAIAPAPSSDAPQQSPGAPPAPAETK